VVGRLARAQPRRGLEPQPRRDVDHEVQAER
jgi:hypothetical protein